SQDSNALSLVNAASLTAAERSAERNAVTKVGDSRQDASIFEGKGDVVLAVERGTLSDGTTVETVAMATQYGSDSGKERTVMWLALMPVRGQWLPVALDSQQISPQNGSDTNSK